MRFYTVTRWLLPVIDVALLNAVTTAAFLVRFGKFPPAYNWDAYLRLFWWDAAALVIIFSIYGLYRPYRQPIQDLSQAVGTAVIVNGFVTLAITFLATDIGFPRSVFLISAILQVPVFLVWRRLHRSLSLREAPTIRVLAVSSAGDDDAMTRRAGQYLPRISVDHRRPTDAVGDPSRYGLVLLAKDVLPPVREQYFIACLKHDVPCLWMPDQYDLLAAGAELTSLAGTPFLELPSVRISRGSLVVKRLADIVLASLGLVVLSPVMALIALAVRLTSPGPVLYWQDRVTVGGRVFRLVKFRTMRGDAEKSSGPVLAGPDDPRVTPLGRFLRASHLDEIPQLWNIVRGEMSLVGPRPERPAFVSQFRSDIPYYDLRHELPAGLTGPAQVMGNYYTPPEHKAAFDLYYAKRQSLLQDLVLMVRTAFGGGPRQPGQGA
jgi:exopolysaccharide biosynthesis polyprenyl glycosylphosphotransferase